MNKNYYARWCEIQFYYICKSTFKKSKDLSTFSALTSVLSKYKKFDVAMIRNAFCKIIADHSFTPSKEEFIILAYKAKYPTAETKRILNTSNKTYYKVVNQYKNDPMGIYPKTKDEDMINAIMDYVEAYHYFKEELL